MAVIPEAEIQFLRLPAMDKVGRVFAWKNDLFRAIYSEAEPRVRQFFTSGCLDALTRRGLFPESEITEHTLAGFAFVVRHKTVPVVTYPREWWRSVYLAKLPRLVKKLRNTIALFGSYGSVRKIPVRSLIEAGRSMFRKPLRATDRPRLDIAAIGAASSRLSANVDPFTSTVFRVLMSERCRSPFTRL